MPRDIDPDYTWLMTHLGFSGAIKERVILAESLAETLLSRIEDGRLPYTIGVFGGWGVGKTTFLAQLAKELSDSTRPRTTVPRSGTTTVKMRRRSTSCRRNPIFSPTCACCEKVSITSRL